MVVGITLKVFEMLSWEYGRAGVGGDMAAIQITMGAMYSTYLAGARCAHFILEMCQLLSPM